MMGAAGSGSRYPPTHSCVPGEDAIAAKPDQHHSNPQNVQNGQHVGGDVRGALLLVSELEIAKSRNIEKASKIPSQNKSSPLSAFELDFREVKQQDAMLSSRRAMLVQPANTLALV